MDNSQHWYAPKDTKAITSERMVSEIIMMNKLKIKAILKFLKSGAMCWMVYLPADEVCAEEWIIALIYNNDFSMPECKEPFIAMMAKPNLDELVAAIKKGGHLKSDFVIPVNTENKGNITCVDAVNNLIKWRKTIYPFLDFTPDEKPVQEEEPAQEQLMTEAIEEAPAEPETEPMQEENQQETEPVVEELTGNFTQNVISDPEKEQCTIGSVYEILQNKPGLTNQSCAINIIADNGDKSMNVNSGAVNFTVVPEDMLITESPDIPEVKSSSISPNTSDDEGDGEFVAPDYPDEGVFFVNDVPLFE